MFGGVRVRVSAWYVNSNDQQRFTLTIYRTFECSRGSSAFEIQFVCRTQPLNFHTWKKLKFYGDQQMLFLVIRRPYG